MKQNNQTKNRKDQKTPKPPLQPGVTMLQEEFKSGTDVDGSYTGVPLDGDRPVQDADDL